MQKRRRHMQYVTATTASLSYTAYGSFMGWTGTTLSQLVSEDSPVPITSDQSSWLASINSLTMLVGIFSAGYLVDVVGRQRLLLASALPLVVWWLMVAFADSYGLLMAARAIGSVGGGVISTAAPVYLAEIADPEVRGTIVALHQVLNEVGSLLIFCTAPYMSIMNASFISLSIPVLFFITFVWMPESPYFLLARNRKEDTEKCLKKLKGNLSDEEMRSEMDGIDETLRRKQEAKGKLIDLFLMPEHRRALLIMVGFIVLQMSTGAIAFSTYTTSIFESSGSEMDADISSIVLGAVQLVTSLVAMAIVDSFGRRTLAIASFLACAVCLVAEGVYFYADHVQGGVPSAFDWVPLTAMIGFHVSFGLGVGSVVYPLIGEMYHASVKGLAASINITVVALYGFFLKKIYQVVSDSIGDYWSFWGFAVFCVGGALYTHCLLPETKGKTFAQINAEMDARVGRAVSPKVPEKTSNSETVTRSDS